MLVALHYIALLCIRLHDNALHYISLSHFATLHYIALHYTTLRFNSYILTYVYAYMRILWVYVNTCIVTSINPKR